MSAIRERVRSHAHFILELQGFLATALTIALSTSPTRVRCRGMRQPPRDVTTAPRRSSGTPGGGGSDAGPAAGAIFFFFLLSRPVTPRERPRRWEDPAAAGDRRKVGELRDSNAAGGFLLFAGRK